MINEFTINKELTLGQTDFGENEFFLRDMLYDLLSVNDLTTVAECLEELEELNEIVAGIIVKTAKAVINE